MSREQYIEPDDSFYRPSRDPNEGTVKLVIAMTVLFVALTTVLAVAYARKDDSGSDERQLLHIGSSSYGNSGTAFDG